MTYFYSFLQIIPSLLIFCSYLALLYLPGTTDAAGFGGINNGLAASCAIILDVAAAAATAAAAGRVDDAFGAEYCNKIKKTSTVCTVQFYWHTKQRPCTQKPIYTLI